MNPPNASHLEEKLGKSVASLGKLPWILFLSGIALLSRWAVPKFLDSQGPLKEKAITLLSVTLIILLPALALRVLLDYWRLSLENKRLKSVQPLPKRFAVHWDARDNPICPNCGNQAQRPVPDNNGFLECPFCAGKPIKLEEANRWVNFDEAIKEVRELRRVGKL